MATSFFNGAFFGGEFFSGSQPPATTGSFFNGAFFGGEFFSGSQAATPGGNILKRKEERRAAKEKELIMMVKEIAPYAFTRLYGDEP